MGLDDRDYMKDEHYPSCTCVACCRKRSEKAAQQKWCDRHDRPMGPSGCQLCLLEREGAPDDGQSKPCQDATATKASATDGEAGDGRGHLGKKISKTLRSVLGKKE